MRAGTGACCPKSEVRDSLGGRWRGASPPWPYSSGPVRFGSIGPSPQKRRVAEALPGLAAHRAVASGPGPLEGCKAAGSRPPLNLRSVSTTVRGARASGWSRSREDCARGPWFAGVGPASPVRPSCTRTPLHAGQCVHPDAPSIARMRCSRVATNRRCIWGGTSRSTRRRPQRLTRRWAPMITPSPVASQESSSDRFSTRSPTPSSTAECRTVRASAALRTSRRPSTTSSAWSPLMCICAPRDAWCAPRCPDGRCCNL